jgi:hypothetical protein
MVQNRETTGIRWNLRLKRCSKKREAPVFLAIIPYRAKQGIGCPKHGTSVVLLGQPEAFAHSEKEDATPVGGGVLHHQGRSLELGLWLRSQFQPAPFPRRIQ